MLPVRRKTKRTYLVHVRRFLRWKEGSIDGGVENHNGLAQGRQQRPGDPSAIGSCDCGLYSRLVPDDSDVRFSCHRAYRFDGFANGRRILGTVYREPGTSGPWFATVDGTTIEIVLSARESAVREAIRQACLPEDQRTVATISRPF